MLYIYYIYICIHNIYNIIYIIYIIYIYIYQHISKQVILERKNEIILKSSH